MILDTSAVVAIIVEEPERDRLLELISDGFAGIGAPSFTEAGLVMIGRMGINGAVLVSRLVHEFAIHIVPFTENHSRLAADAFWRYGKGRNPAALNYGDCMTYATAAMAKQPLLCLGDDFAQTDLELVAL